MTSRIVYIAEQNSTSRQCAYLVSDFADREERIFKPTLRFYRTIDQEPVTVALHPVRLFKCCVNSVFESLQFSPVPFLLLSELFLTHGHVSI